MLLETHVELLKITKLGHSRGNCSRNVEVFGGICSAFIFEHLTMNWAKWAVCLKRLKGKVEQKGRENVQENRKNEKLSD
jgi:hypothetical protein